jgi:stage III sporulation protein AE
LYSSYRRSAYTDKINIGGSMKNLLILMIMMIVIAVPASAIDFTAPPVPNSVEQFFPEETENFGNSLIQIIREAIHALHPSLREAFGVCLRLVSAALLTGLVKEISVGMNWPIDLIGTVFTGLTLLQPTQSMIRLGADTVREISQYGNLLLPVMTGAMAAQGAVTKSGALYTATAFFDMLLSKAISNLMVPLVYCYICISIAVSLFRQTILNDIHKFVKGMISWSLKSTLYIFTGYISITGVVGGTTDATLLKATKLTISGMVPVVGGILSDASEAILVSASLMKNAAGIYGLLAVIVIWIGPFLRIGVQYLMLKTVSGLCGMFGTKSMARLINDFSVSMGLILAMTGTVCLIFLISTVCFMKGVS